jgi:acyl dehydratase
VTAPTLTSEKVSVGDVLPTLDLNVTARTVVMGASSSRDWQPQHHDHAWAIDRAGTRDIFLNTPNQAGWIERYLTDWTGPHGRLGRLRFRMRRPVFPGETLVFSGTVTAASVDDQSCAWVEAEIRLTVGSEVATEAFARIAVPRDIDDNPWARAGEDWRP